MIFLECEKVFNIHNYMLSFTPIYFQRQSVLHSSIPLFVFRVLNMRELALTLLGRSEPQNLIIGITRSRKILLFLSFTKQHFSIAPLSTMGILDPNFTSQR